MAVASHCDGRHTNGETFAAGAPMTALSPPSGCCSTTLGLAGLRGDRRGPHSASHEKAAIGWRNPIRWTTVGGADHENDDEGAAFCGAQIGASGPGSVQ